MMCRLIVFIDYSNFVFLRLMNFYEDFLVIYKGIIVGIFELIRIILFVDSGELIENINLFDYI